MGESRRDDLMLAGDAAKYLGVSRQRVHFLTKTGRLKPAETIGGMAFYSKEQLDAYQADKGKEDAAMMTPVMAV